MQLEGGAHGLAEQLDAIETGMATSLELLPWRNYARDLGSDLRSGSTRACPSARRPTRC